MSYKKSQLDKKNFKWFAADSTRASMVSIELQSGVIRGLSEFRVDISYPITVFSGSNGSGKSTMLALSACAYHNAKNAYIPPLRNKPYYTFHDFFVQSGTEPPVDGVKIKFGFNHNNWTGGRVGIGYQVRLKKKGGKWNDYDSRIKRSVIYFGVQRVVPHYERSTHKSYRSKFKPGKMTVAKRKRITDIAARVIGKPYTDFDSYVHTKYSLPVATVNGVSYSGFNMGAGEGSVFEILTALMAAGDGTLLVIDEIELGLHELAQVRLIDELKKLCEEMKCQIICSSHSYGVLRSLPPEARFHIESIGGKTFITPGISAEFACGKMGKPDAHELDIFVEDRIAGEILQAAFPVSVRKRVKIKPIGSHTAVVRQLSSRWLEKIDNCLCVLDGDQNGKIESAKILASKTREASTDEVKDQIYKWVSDRILYLPGDEWPEKWLIDQAISLVKDAALTSVDDLVDKWGLAGRPDLVAALDEAASAEKHSEFRDLSISIELSEDKCRSDLIALVVKCNSAAFTDLVSIVQGKLL